jgi:uncharacterized membrane protein
LEQDEARTDTFGTERVLAFSDGVFAVAITLLVFNLTVPEVRRDLLGALGKEWPHYLSYVTSFLLIGILWANHHHIFNHVKRANHTFLIINVVFLMWVAVVPFPTAILAAYLDNPPERRTAMVIYAITFFVGSLLFNLLWRYATTGDRLTGENPNHDVIEKTNQSYLLGPIVYAVDVVVSFINPIAGLVLFIVLGILYGISPFPGGGMTRVPREKG